LNLEWEEYHDLVGTARQQPVFSKFDGQGGKDETLGLFEIFEAKKVVKVKKRSL